MEQLNLNLRFGITLDLEPSIYVIKTRANENWKYQTHCFFLMDFLVQSGVTFEEPVRTVYYASNDWSVRELKNLIDNFWTNTGNRCIENPV
jgi:hypothetical protein